MKTMSLDKAIKYGKEHRKSWEGTNKQYTRSCRNHGTCSFCQGNRLHKFRDKHPETMEEAIDAMTELHERSCPDCGNNLYIVRDDGAGGKVYICTCCGMRMWMEDEKNEN